MSDLISRKAVMELIESKCVDGAWENEDTTFIDAYGLIDDVGDMPTAYDTDNVVEQIHEYFKGEVDSLNGKEPWDILKHNRVVCEIVKRGGIDED